MGKFFDGWNGIALFYVLGFFDLIWILVCPSMAIPLAIAGMFSVATGAVKLYNKIYSKRHPKKELKIKEVDKSELNNMTEEWLVDKLDWYKSERIYSSTVTLSQTDEEKVVVKGVTKSDLDVAITVKKANAIRERKQKEEKKQLIADTLKDLAQDKIENRDEVVSALMNKDWETLQNRKIKQNQIDTQKQIGNQTNVIKTESVDANKDNEVKKEDEMDLSGFKPEMAEYIKKLKQNNKSQNEDSNTLNM